jgi:restriction endonuclease Mrr
VHSAIFNPAAHEMAIPDYQTLMLPGLEFTNRGETNVRDCIAVLADKLELTS